MIAPYVDVDKARQRAQIIVRPNRSLTWRGNLMFLGLIAVISLAIASGFALLGFWIVFPFAGLELMALAVGLYVVGHRLSRCEVITVEGDTVEVETGYRYPQERNRFLRSWVKVERQEQGRHRSRLLLLAHGKEIELGACLTEDEKSILERELRRLLPLGATVA
jgi:uncharacterized membrane protein